MIPIRDTIPANRTAWIVRLLVLANIILFVAEYLQGPRLEAFLYQYGFVPGYWTFADLGAWWRWPGPLGSMVTSQFLHGSVLHLGSNMLYLWIFGDNVEDRLGHGRFLGLYLLSGLAAALTQAAMQPESTVPMIGASGAIAGVLGAYFVQFPYARIVTLVPLFFVWEFVEIPAFLFLGLWFVLQWFQGLSAIGQIADVGGVAFWAHVGGFVAGLVLLRLIRPRR